MSRPHRRFGPLLNLIGIFSLKFPVLSNTLDPISSSIAGIYLTIITNRYTVHNRIKRITNLVLCTMRLPLAQENCIIVKYRNTVVSTVSFAIGNIDHHRCSDRRRCPEALKNAE